MNALNYFKYAFAATAVGLIVAALYGGWQGLAVAGILGVLEVSLSFDNAVVNAGVLVRMNAFWQKMFLSVGIIIAVFGMRLLFPFIVVGITGKLNPVEAMTLAMAKGDPEVPGTYGYILAQAHPGIAAFGGMFLVMIFLDWLFEEREITWLGPVERFFAKVGHLDQLSVIVAQAILVVSALTIFNAHALTVLIAGSSSLLVYLAVKAVGDYFENKEEDAAGAATVIVAAGKHALALFLYLELLDASFSFDGVMGAFAVTSDPILIAIGLGIGAMYIRSLTVLMVRKGTLDAYVHLEHGAHWAIGTLAILLLVTIATPVPEVVTGLLGVAFILAAIVTSVIRKRRGENASEVEVVEAEATETPAV